MFFDDDLTAVLHVARVSGVVSPDRLAHALGAGEDTVAAVLADATDNGLLRHRPTGAMAGWSLTPEGRELHAEKLQIAVRRCTFVDAVAQADDAFVELNAPFKELCTRWQLEGQPASCVDDLGPIHEHVSEVLDSLAAMDARFGVYRQRLDDAIARLRNGDTTALTKPLSGSYHDVWMEIHQDLILTSGRERAAADGH